MGLRIFFFFFFFFFFFLMYAEGYVNWLSSAYTCFPCNIVTQNVFNNYDMFSFILWVCFFVCVCVLFVCVYVCGFFCVFS